MKKIVSVLVALAMIMSSMISVSPSSVIASDADIRGGFVLTPSVSDSTGISIDSTFTLSSQNSVSLNDITNHLSIDNEPLPVITEKSANNFEIVLSRPFEHNKLYTFRITVSGSDDITWVFQTSAVFEIEGTLPADKSTSVPVNTGIEIYFSSENYESIDNYFEITPNVEGRFEKHGKTCVFVPNELKNGTLYTVTVKKRVKTCRNRKCARRGLCFRF